LTLTTSQPAAPNREISGADLGRVSQVENQPLSYIEISGADLGSQSESGGKSAP